MQVPALSTAGRFDLAHLARRFFQVLRVRPLTPVEQGLVEELLRESERPLFWAQAPADQRHGYETMRRASRTTSASRVLRAALLHDVGKAETRLGPVGRSLATLLDAAGATLRGPLLSYRSHGRLGAALLESTGAEPLVVDFAGRHPDRDPGRNDPGEWAVLLEADDV